jgi:hypothetical protein
MGELLYRGVCYGRGFIFVGSGRPRRRCVIPHGLLATLFYPLTGNIALFTHHFHNHDTKIIECCEMQAGRGSNGDDCRRLSPFRCWW